MTDLLEKVLDAHGGLDNWRRVNTIDFRLTMRGGLLPIKQQPQGLRDVQVKVDARRPRTVITPFPAPGSRGVFDAGRIRFENDDGTTTLAVDEPRKSFEGHKWQTPWAKQQFLYFVSYAFQSYMTMPFLLAQDDVLHEEIEPHEEQAEVWRVLKVTFPTGMDVHSPVQKFYFDHRGYLVRNDYFTEVSPGTPAHYTFDHRKFDGFVFPTHRRVVMRDQKDHARLTAPSIFIVDIESVVLTRG